MEPQLEVPCVQIKAVMRGSPLQGVVKRGDCISDVDGSATARPEVLAAKIDSKHVGDVVVLKIASDRRVSVKLVERPSDVEARACQASSEVETQVSVHRAGQLYRLALFPWIRPTLVAGFCS